MQSIWTHSYSPIFTVIYLQCVSLIESQYSLIWHDSMSNCDNWDQLYGYTECGYNSGTGGCQINPCVKMESEDAAGHAKLERVTNIASYSSLQLQISVTTWKMESGEYCDIYFEYDDVWIDHTENLLCRLNPPDDSGFYHYFDTVCDFPSSVGKTDVLIRLQNEGQSDDVCYWDEVYLKGVLVPETSPTPNPSRKPSPDPTTNPTQKPTSNPTQRPTSDPTAKPTNPADIATCGDTVSGPYHGVPVLFVVNLPYYGNLQFNAAGSNFVVTDLEASTNLGVLLATDLDADEQVTIYDMPAGTYKFSLNGGGTSSGTFHATIVCFSADPTPYPTQPTDKPTPYPTHKPTPNPTSRSIDTPRRAPSHIPTPNPTKRPMVVAVPTSGPSLKPTTPSPTQPGALACGETTVGTYSSGELIFETTMPFTGQLIFDANASNFNIERVEAFTGLGNFLASDSDHDHVLTLNVPPGDYTFRIVGETSGVYHAEIRCVSNEPTSSTTQPPSITSTEQTPAPVDHTVTQHPSVVPTSLPSLYPTTAKPSTLRHTKSPTKDPTLNDVFPTRSPVETEVTSAPSVRVTKSTTNLDSGSEERIEATQEYIDIGTVFIVIIICCGCACVCGCVCSKHMPVILKTFHTYKEDSPETINIQMDAHVAYVIESNVVRIKSTDSVQEPDMIIGHDLGLHLDTNDRMNEEMMHVQDSMNVNIGSKEYIIGDMVMDEEVEEENNMNIADDEFVIKGDDDPVQTVAESNMNIAEDEFVIRGDDDTHREQSQHTKYIH
eukprot:36217_1